MAEERIEKPSSSPTINAVHLLNRSSTQLFIYSKNNYDNQTDIQKPANAS